MHAAERRDTATAVTGADAAAVGRREWYGSLPSHRVEVDSSGRDARLASSVGAEAIQNEGGSAMLKVLVPVDGSPNALRAVRHAIDEYRRHHELELHLLNVQPRLSKHISRFVSRQDREAWHRERAEEALRAAQTLLVEAGVPHGSHWAVGDRAREICRAAKRLGVHHIVMGTARKNSLTRMLEDSSTNKVLESTPVPVEVVTGDAVSRWERWGLVPIGVAGAGGLALLAID
jgi:nucleotide-binding universal stress UspA family protein